MLQCGMKKHAANGKCHIGQMENTESLFKPLAYGVDKTNKCQNNAWYIGYSVVKFCNI